MLEQQLIPNTSYPLLPWCKSHPGSSGTCYSQSRHMSAVIFLPSLCPARPLENPSLSSPGWGGRTPLTLPRLQEHALPPRDHSAPALLPPHYCFNQSLNWLFGNPGCSRLVTALSLFNWSLNLLPAMIMRLVSPGSLRTVNYPCRPQPIRHTKSANCSD